MKLNRIATIALVAAAIPMIAGAQAVGRISAKVVDMEGQPIAGVKITITTPDLDDYEDIKKSNKKGRFLSIHADSTYTYTYKLEKEGYEPLVERVRARFNEITDWTFVLRPAGSGSADQPLPPAGQAANAYNAGVEAQNAGDLDTAVDRFDRAASLDPTLAAPHTGLAGVYFMQEKWAESAAEAEKALQLDPGDHRALQIRYNAYHKAGDEDKAAEAAAALKASGGDAEAASRVFNEAIDAYQAGDGAKARDLLEEAISVNPEMSRPRLLLAAIYREQGEIELASAQVEEVLNREPDNPLGNRLSYEIAAARGEWEREMAAAEKLVGLDPEYAGAELFRRGVELYDGDRFQEAAEMMSLCLQARSDEARAHFILGMASFNFGDSETAKTHLGRFVELAPDDPDAAIARDLLSYSN